MKITLIGGDANGQVFEIKEHRPYIELIDPIGRKLVYIVRRWYVDGEYVMFYVLAGMGSEESERLIREVLSKTGAI